MHERTKRPRLFWLIPLCLALAGAAEAQQSAGVERVELFGSDTLDVSFRVALSPDGRWLAFAAMEAPSTASLWIKPLGGGAPERLTSSGHWDGNPVWSPSGDRLFFVSDRPARAGDRYEYGMVLPIDPATGRAAGPPRQVTADPVPGMVLPSPDGRFLAHMDAIDRGRLKILPSSGGTARVVATLPERSGNLSWTSDGQAIIYVTGYPDRGERVVSRIPTSGGESTVLARLDVERGWVVVGPDARRFVIEENGDGPRDRTLKVVDRQGNVLRTLATNRDTRTSGFTADGRSVLAVESNVVAPTRLMPVAGGAYREITPPIGYDWVMGFTGDGSAVYTWTEDDGKAVLARVGLEDGARTVLPEDSEVGFEGGNSRYLFQATRRVRSEPRTLFAVDLKDGTRHTVTAAMPGINRVFPSGPGGTWAAHEELYYYESDDDRVHVKGWTAPGRTRTLRTLPASVLDRADVAVHGERVAWQEVRGDSTVLVIADGPTAEPRSLLSWPAAGTGGNEISFSRDGRLLSLHYSTGPGSPDLMAIVDPAGKAAPRIIDTGLRYWYWPRWMPDNSGVAVIGGGAGSEANVVLVPVRDGEAPVNLTRADPAPKWGFEISPDGRYIAYPGEIWKGSAIWKLDLGGTAASAGAGGR